MLTRIGNKVTVGRPLCNVLRIGRPLEGGGSFLRDWTVYGKSEVVGSSVLGVGDSIPWNQLVQNTAIRTGSGISQTYDAATGLMKINGTATADGIFYGISSYGAVGTSLPGNHKGLFTIRFVSGSFSGTTGASSAVSTAYTGLTCAFSNGLGYYEGINTVTNAQYFLMRFKAGDTFNDFTYKAQMFDLTAIFGSGNEPNTVDAFKAWLVKVGKMSKVTDDIPYFPYDAGSTFTSLPIVATGKNLFDMDNNLLVGYYLNANTGVVTQSSDGSSSCFADFLPCKPNTQYTLQKDVASFPVATYLRICVYDVNKTYISTIVNRSSAGALSETGTTPANAAYIRCSFGTIGYATTNVMLSEGSTRQEYEPYHGQRFPLVISSPLHGIGDVRDIMRYSDHGITRKYGVVDLGTLNWIKNAAQSFRSADLSNLIKHTSSGTVISNILSNKYATITAANAFTAALEGIGSNESGNLYVYDAALKDSTPASFKTAMSGVLLVYELATPTFEPVTLPKLPAYRDGTVLYTDTQVHGDTIAGEAPVGFSLLPPVTMTPPTGDADTNGQTDDTATE